MKQAMFVAPFDAMWREVGCLFRALEAQRADLEEAVRGLSTEQVDARPVAKAPSIGSLLAGVGLEEAAWIHERWRPGPTPPAWRDFGGGAGGRAPDAIVAWLREVREATRLKLMKTNDVELDRQTIAAPEGAASLRWVLHRLVDRSAFTRGQIVLLRGAP